MYRDIFPGMIKAWREAFQDPEMPFGILSLCTDGYPQTRDNYCEKMFNAGIDIRDAQYETFLELFQAGDKNIGFVSTYDLRRRWYHPQLKIPAGERIARWALATQYGFERQVQWKPPMLVEVEQRDGALVLTWTPKSATPRMERSRASPSPATTASSNRPTSLTPRKARTTRGRLQVDRKQLVLTSPLVPEPIHFRYAWGRNPLANLQATGNKDLPLATQRSDDWPMEFVPLGVLDDPVTLPLSRGDRNKILQALRAQDQARRLFEAKQVIAADGD